MFWAILAFLFMAYFVEMCFQWADPEARARKRAKANRFFGLDDDD